jgi:hypothetical protein
MGREDGGANRRNRREICIGLRDYERFCHYCILAMGFLPLSLNRGFMVIDL